MIIAGRHRLVDGGKDLVGGHDVEDRKLAHPPWVVESHAVANAAAAVVAGHEKRLETQGPHDLDLVLGHGAFRVCGVGIVAERFGTVAVATQIGHHHREALGQPGSDLVPHDVGLGIAVQKQERRPGTAVHGVDDGAIGLNVGRAKTLEHGRAFVAGFGVL